MTIYQATRGKPTLTKMTFSDFKKMAYLNNNTHKHLGKCTDNHVVTNDEVVEVESQGKMPKYARCPVKGCTYYLVLIHEADLASDFELEAITDAEKFV